MLGLFQSNFFVDWDSRLLLNRGFEWFRIISSNQFPSDMHSRKVPNKPQLHISIYTGTCWLAPILLIGTYFGTFSKKLNGTISSAFISCTLSPCPKVICYNSLISASGKGSEWSWALHFFQELSRSRLGRPGLHFHFFTSDRFGSALSIGDGSMNPWLICLLPWRNYLTYNPLL